MKQTLDVRASFESKLRALRSVAVHKIGGAQGLTAVAELKDMVNKEAKAFVQAGSPPISAPANPSNAFVTPARSSTQVAVVESPGKSATTLDLPQHWPAELDFVVKALQLPRHLASDTILESVVLSLREGANPDQHELDVWVLLIFYCSGVTGKSA